MRQELSSLMPASNGRNKINVRDAINPDIIAVIHKNFPVSREQALSAKKEFASDSALESSRKIWNFLKYKIKYVRDPENSQMIRLPNRLIKDGKGDCKSFSLFAASFLSALGLPVAFRYASYGSSPIPSHVYVVTKDENGNEIIVDGVWNKFNSEKPYTFKKDHFMRVMTLSGINGRGRARRQAKKTERKAKREQRAERRGGAKGVKRIALAAPRTAFLGMIALNVRGVATKLSNAIKKNPSRTKTMWNKLGGNYNKLVKAVENGAKKKRILGTDDDGIGSVAALAASAAPVLVVIMKFLKGEGIQDEDGNVLLEGGLDALRSSGQEELPNNLSELDVQDAESGSGSGSGAASLFSNPKILLIGGAALLGGIFLLSKKRK
jgi:hypothetical protein